MTLALGLRTRSMRRARDLTSLYGGAQPPFSLRPLLHHYRVSNVQQGVLDRDARLFRDGRAFAIQVNGAVPEVRRRMSVAHEIGHLIVHEVAGSMIPRGSTNTEIERLCNDLAGELLCPTEAVHEFFEKEQSGLSDWRCRIRCQTVMEAAQKFNVSVDLMAKRVFCDLRMAPAALAVVWRYVSHSKTGAAPALRVCSAWHSKGREVFIPLNKTAPPASVVSKAFDRDGVFLGVEHLHLGGIRDNCEIEATGFMSFPLGSLARPTRAVLSLIVPKSGSGNNTERTQEGGGPGALPGHDCSCDKNGCRHH